MTRNRAYFMGFLNAQWNKLDLVYNAIQQRIFYVLLFNVQGIKLDGMHVCMYDLHACNAMQVRSCMQM